MKQEKRRQQSIRRRIKNKIESTLFNVGMIAFFYYALIMRGVKHGEKKEEKQS